MYIKRSLILIWNHRKSLALSVLWSLLVFLAPGMQMEIHAAFPADMAKHPVLCRPFQSEYGMVYYYYDSGLKEGKGWAGEDTLALYATKTEGNSIYGTFDHDGVKETAWFDLAQFVEDPEYQHEYYTVRRPMTVYSDSLLDQEEAEIKKYSGVIVIGRRKNWTSFVKMIKKPKKL